MTQLETLMLDVTNTLNHNGFDEVKAVPNNTQFSIRVNYWDRIPASLIETMEDIIVFVLQKPIGKMKIVAHYIVILLRL